MTEHCEICGCEPRWCECKKPSASDSKSTSSDEAYHTVIKIERYKELPVDPKDEILLEDSYAFTIGKHTFPEVLTLVDDIRACVELMK